MSQLEWWRGAVIYQVYPRSFMDANGDGVGDIQGVIAKLPYIKSLGVDAIWLSPFFKSPMKDFGYDISDYRDVDPMFGTKADFDELMSAAKGMDIKIVIDQVLSHTSNEHPWFEESRQDRTNPKADWYVWADAKPDGTPPNNWLSIFGGCGWQWEPRRQQYYLHNFLTEQPDLNFHNADVREAVLANVEYWLKKGVDGFRLDAINFCFHDKLLRDNPAKAPEDRKGRGFSEDNPYAFQYHYFNNTQPENLAFMEEIRALINKYPGTTTLGEISTEDSLKSMAEYTADNKRLHMAYSFELLTEDFSPAYIRQTVEDLEANLDQGWPCWAIGNHDVQRVATRWGKNATGNQLPKMLNAMLGSLRGSLCTYQGEELGLVEADIAFEELQDPFGIAFWPNFKGRDGCRTPMPWTEDQAHAGFSKADKTWLPVSNKHNGFSVASQEHDADSVLNGYRQFYSWRKQYPALVAGDIEFVDLNENVLAFFRRYNGQTIFVAFNFSGQPQAVTLDQSMQGELLSGHGLAQASVSDGNLTLDAHGAAFVQI
ncbi:alpha-glucosidase family protein [Thalassotalea agarivorans]|uniref:Alpha-glucosidase n=1 Tax=Thalassotalea agarivorans TaxID=349064 RepID=A0A1I0BWR4_THASX|nr:alpha-glucosidase family protein [Thalassotalea agarivorans]SET10927.1 alpha-glucosidase [Thalassotalea agarivorans]